MITRSLLAPIAALFASVLLLVAPSAQAQQLKIAVIDLRRAVADTEDGLRMKSKLQELSDQRENDYAGKEKEYGKAKDELERLAKDGKTPDAELRKKYALLEKQALELQASGMNIRRELMQRENELMTPILNKLNGLVHQLAQQEGYDLVVSRDAVPYFRKDLEITDKIIGMYNASAPAVPAEEKKPKDKKEKKAPATQAPSPDGEAPAAPPPAKPEKKKADKKKPAEKKP